MKWRFGGDDIYRWHTWFAWHPVRVDGNWVWGERLRRSAWIDMDASGWSYRLIGGDNAT